MATGALSITCGHCGRGVSARVAAGSASAGNVAWLQCPLCHDGSVRTLSGAIYPPTAAGSTVANLPADVEGAWREVRVAHNVAAYTAAEIMCRKILMHLAVDVAASTPGKKFVEYVNDLDSAGYITKGLKQVVDQIRDRGNIANHDLPASTEQDSLMTLTITEHLLKATYELPGLGSATSATAT